MQFEVPTPSSRFDVEMEDGVKVRARRYGNPGGTRLLVAHGNGFAVDAYYPFWERFLAGYDVVIFDFRNHGQSGRSPVEAHTYAQLAHDLDRVISATEAELGKRTTVGVMHSFASRTAMKHAVEIGWKWAGLMLFDPPNVPPQSHPVYAMMEQFEDRLVKYAGARRRTFNSIDELTEEYLASRATARWVDGAHALMARSVLRKDEGASTYSLVCSPEVEASIYAQALSLNLWPKASEFGGPVRLVGCDPEMKGAPATGIANRTLGAEGGFDYVCVRDTGHLQQIERPDACADVLTEFLEKNRLTKP
ncbi:MAG: alpha/beta hydrolase [Hyphomicrobiaceae bacterium]